MRKALLASTAAGLVLAVGFAAPAFADDTTVTVTVAAADGLTITVPATADLGTVAPGGTATGQLGAVTIADQRAVLDATWVASVIAGEFTTGAGSDPESILPTNISYWSGPATATTGDGAPTPGQVNLAAAVVISAIQIAFSHPAGDGDNSATWNPTLIINVPAGNVAGVYTGTVTHTVL